MQLSLWEIETERIRHLGFGLTARAGMMVDGPGTSAGIYDLLVNGHGWTMLMTVNLMLFALLHNPCATTIITIYKETKSYKWTAVSVLITLGTAFLVTFLTASIARLMGWA
jgi:ferrous iron transport protein B